MLGRGISETGNPVQSGLARAWAALQQNRFEAVIDAAKSVLGYDANNLQAYWLWALSAINLARHGEAVAVLDEGLGRIADGDPIRVRFLTQRAHTVSVMGWNGDAWRTAVQALKIVEANPAIADADTLHFLGASLMQSGNEADALPVLRRASQANPQNPLTWNERGEAAEYMGLPDEAEAAFEQAIATGQHTGAHMALARLRRWTPQRNHIARLEALSTRTAVDEAHRAYALFKEYDDLDQTDVAWNWLQSGAAAARQEPVEIFNPAWSAADERAQVEAWISSFSKTRFSHSAIPFGEPKRIFVIGMPRSGTTLVERILGAHSQVKALGELQSFPGAVKVLSGVPGADLLTANVVSAMAGVDPARLAHYYNRDLDYIDDGRCTVDKLPRNADYAGLIRLAFPDARIVHVRRDPMDTLFGAYKLHFVARWSYDQDDLADRYTNHRALMAHWKVCLGDGLIDVSLEAIIRDPETQIRQLLDQCGLPFEAACLSPHKSLGAVSSASSSQVRQPINAAGVGAWRRYETQLAPLHRRLSDIGLLD
jgi:tetratricopeptide (TPR) repeat protein